jgi:hypothetical protein
VSADVGAESTYVCFGCGNQVNPELLAFLPEAAEMRFKGCTCTDVHEAEAHHEDCAHQGGASNSRCNCVPFFADVIPQPLVLTSWQRLLSDLEAPGAASLEN